MSLRAEIIGRFNEYIDAFTEIAPEIDRETMVQIAIVSVRKELLAALENVQDERLVAVGQYTIKVCPHSLPE